MPPNPAPPPAPSASIRTPMAAGGRRAGGLDLGPKFQVRQRHFSFLECVALVAAPSLLFIFNCYFFALAYQRSPRVVLSVVLATFAVCTFQCSRVAKEPEEAFRFYITAACAVAVFASTPVGLFAYTSFFSEYWFCRSSHSYANVLPSESASGYVDAGMIVFAEEARIDASRGVGYKDVHNFCVAPILDDADDVSRVQFWAAGVDCCGPRGTFACDDAWDKQAHAGIVLSPQRADWRPEFALAIKQAEAAFGIASAKEPVFVRWLVDPERVSLNFWRIGNGIVLAASMVFLMLSGTVTLFVNSALKGFTDYAPGRGPRDV